MTYLSIHILQVNKHLLQERYTALLCTSNCATLNAVMPLFLIFRCTTKHGGLSGPQETASKMGNRRSDLRVHVSANASNTGEIMEKIVDQIHYVVRHKAKLPASEKIIFALDQAKCHSKEVCQSLHRKNYLVRYIPAGLTWLCQPIDTHLARRFKIKLRNLTDPMTDKEVTTWEGKCKIMQEAWIGLRDQEFCTKSFKEDGFLFCMGDGVSQLSKVMQPYVEMEKVREKVDGWSASKAEESDKSVKCNFCGVDVRVALDVFDLVGDNIMGVTHCPSVDEDVEFHMFG